MVSEEEMLKSATESFINIIRGTLAYDEKKKELLRMGKTYGTTEDLDRWMRNSICYDMDDFSYTIGWNIEGDYGLSIAYASIDEHGAPEINEKVFIWEL